MNPKITKALSDELRRTHPTPEDSIEYIESFLDKIRVEADMLRDALITNSPKADSSFKKISIEPLYEILSVLKETNLVENKDIESPLDYSVLSSANKLKKYTEKQKSILHGLQIAYQIAFQAKDKQEIISNIRLEIAKNA